MTPGYEGKWWSLKMKICKRKEAKKEGKNDNDEGMPKIMLIRKATGGKQ